MQGLAVAEDTEVSRCCEPFVCYIVKSSKVNGRFSKHFYRNQCIARNRPLLRQLPKIAAVSGRFLPYALFEMGDKVAGIPKAAVFGDLLYAQPGGAQQYFCMVDAARRALLGRKCRRYKYFLSCLENAVNAEFLHCAPRKTPPSAIRGMLTIENLVYLV